MIIQNFIPTKITKSIHIFKFSPNIISINFQIFSTFAFMNENLDATGKNLNPEDFDIEKKIASANL